MLARMIRKAAKRAGFSIDYISPITDPYETLAFFGQQAGATTILDVGANEGQFAGLMLRTAWAGKILSFEPLSAAHAALSTAAVKVPRWEVAPRMAVGATAGTAQINVSGNSQSSSLLPMLDRHRVAAPQSAYIQIEEVQVRTLPEALAGRDPGERYVMKLDVQGFEAQVIEGAAPILDRCPVIFLEMSLQPLYEGELLFTDLSAMLIGLGYRCVGLRPSYFDPATREIMQVDGTFVRS